MSIAKYWNFLIPMYILNRKRNKWSNFVASISRIVSFNEHFYLRACIISINRIESYLLLRIESYLLTLISRRVCFNYSCFKVTVSKLYKLKSTKHYCKRLTTWRHHIKSCQHLQINSTDRKRPRRTTFLNFEISKFTLILDRSVGHYFKPATGSYQY